MSDREPIPSAADFGDAVEHAPGTAAASVDTPHGDAGVDAAPQPQPAVEAGARTSIDLGNSGDVEYWSDRFNVTPAQFEEAVSAGGSDIHAVTTYLRGQGSAD